ncbi:cation efflux protein [Xylariaceae sp. FL0255]|nr:cation efflux protein [Xylariaceae sp. FL0255]
MSVPNPFSQVSAQLSSRYSARQRLVAVICITFSFFIAEIVVAFDTKSLALLADAFHYLNDFIGYLVALAAIIVSEQDTSPRNFSFGWARATLLGAFFNGVFLLALGLSIFLQSIEKFISIRPVDQPKLVLITGAVGLALNVLSALLVHEHHGHSHGGSSHGHTHHNSYEERRDSHATKEQENSDTHPDLEAAVPEDVSSHSAVIPTPLRSHAEHRHSIAQLQEHGHDLGMLGILLHVVVDALSNVLVMASAIVIWLTSSPSRYYVDPAVSLVISIIIFFPAINLMTDSGKILLQSAPDHLKLDNVKHDIEEVQGIEAVHELHVWSLNQEKLIATAHVTVSSNELTEFMRTANIANKCLHSYGIHSVTLQPECSDPARRVSPAASQTVGDAQAITTTSSRSKISATSTRRRRIEIPSCQITCGNLCNSLTCCDGTPGARRV